jgi:hypothetical protein
MAPKINIDGRFLRGQIYDTSGLYLADDAPGVNVGLAPGFEVAASDVTIRGLSINRFAGAGVFVFNGSNNVHIEDNAIGNGAAGIYNLGLGTGIHLNYATNAVIARNVIASSEGSGILLVSGSGTAITANRIGTSADGLTALPNLDNGITLYDGTNGTIIDGNQISGNGAIGGPNGWGIDIQQSGTLAEVTNTVITNNSIGLDANGAIIDRGGPHYVLSSVDYGPIARGNVGGGIRVQKASGTVVGGVGGGNVISGNGGQGVFVTGANAGAAPRVTHNWIGTDATGTLERGNLRGVEVSQSSAVIGGVDLTERNLVSANLMDGIVADGNTIIRNNYVGVKANGTEVMTNSRYNGPDCCHTNIFVIAPANTVTGNVVGGDDTVIGIRSGGALGAAPNSIGLNFVGTDLTGTVDLGQNLGIGLFGDQSGTTVSRNVIRFNNFGVWLVEGTVGATVGGPTAADGNTIRDNTTTAVMVGYDPTATDRNNRILSNVISGHQWPPIVLGGNHAVGNDLDDVDGGPNGQQNFPLLSAPTTTAGSTLVNISLNSTPSSSFLVQVFANAACGLSGYGEGERLVGTFNVFTDGTGNASGPAALTISVPAGDYVSATATDANGNTSEFGPCVQVVAGAPPAVITSVSPASGKSGEGFLVVHGTNLPAGLGDVVADLTSGAGASTGNVFYSPSSSTAVYVRLQGAALGGGTIQLRNNASTVVSNAFPITITANPGTPVITAVRDAGYNVITSPVAAGSTINVSAEGIDTTGAVVHFVQGANAWDVPVALTASDPSIGLAAQASIPAAALPGAIDVSIRQGASALSAAVTITISAQLR